MVFETCRHSMDPNEDKRSKKLDDCANLICSQLQKTMGDRWPQPLSNLHRTVSTFMMYN